jgi:hypothetical protein
MFAAIHFNHKFLFRGAEVHNKAADGMLSAEFDAVQAPISELRPEHGLGLGWLNAELAGLLLDEGG